MLGVLTDVCDVAGDWMRHPPSEMFKNTVPEDWDECLRNTSEWIAAHPRRRKVKGKRKREIPLATGECCASCSAGPHPF